MSRARYPLLFTMSVIVLTAATLVSYGRIGGVARSAKTTGRWPGDSAPEHPPLVIPTRADYERFAAPDSAWRAQNARQYSVAELRARGDGTRSDREVLDDRVYLLTKRGDTRGAVSTLERWSSQPAAIDCSVTSARSHVGGRQHLRRLDRAGRCAWKRRVS